MVKYVMDSMEAVAYYIQTSKVLKNIENFWYCETRDQSQARIAKWVKLFVSFGENLNNSIILGSIIGEITNNSFDHNLGRWTDSSGCVVGIHLENNIIKINIADRGQGIVSTLRHQFSELTENSEILNNAFTKRVSGRAHEKRGNGLKYVNQHITNSNNYLYCFSNSEKFQIGHSINIKFDHLENLKNSFTYIYLEWKIL